MTRSLFSRRRAGRRLALAGLGALLLAGCGAGRWFGGGVPDGTVAGTVTYRERIALPPGALMVVRLEEVSRADTPAVLIAEQFMETRGRQPPFAFELRYKGEAIRPEREYLVSAEVLVLERPMFVSDTATPVLTRGRAAKGIEIVLRRAGRSPED